MESSSNSFSSLHPFKFERDNPNAVIKCLRRDASIVLVGALEPMKPVNNQQVAFYRRPVTGSLIGSIAETQEVLDFGAAHNSIADVEIIPIQEVSEADKRVEKGDIQYRSVIDRATLQEETVKA